MNESMRTLIFVGLAILSLVVANFAGPALPKPPTEYGNIRAEFFPDFKDASAAKSLTLVSYNADQGEIRVFGVEQGPDQVWRIPTRNNYPVDGKDRLSKTATSVIGIKRESLAGTRKSQHADFGVLDPNGGKVSDFKGIGNRIILKDGKGGKTLADLIIGKEAKGRPGYFYIRNPNEDQTYLAKVKIDVSTKFGDWIEPDLLKLDATKLRTVVIEKHSVEIKNGRGAITGEETNKLTRSGATDKWKLDGIDDATEDVNEDEIRKLVQALDDLKIVGVRPKSDRLKKAFQTEKGLSPDPRAQLELQDMGFFIVPTQSGRVQLVSQEGDVLATTDQGVVYDLHFGQIFTGNELEVEAGFIGSDDKPKDGEKKDPEKKADEKKDGEAVDKPEDSKSKKIKSRYFFATVSFDAEGIGPKPTAPMKPEPPAEDAKKPDDDAAAADAAAADNAAKEDPKKAYEAALAAYDAQVRKYDADVKAYDDKVAAGKKQVKELNRRFSEWYYVISGDSFEELRQGRKTLVKPKAPAAGNKADDAGGLLKRDPLDQN